MKIKLVFYSLIFVMIMNILLLGVFYWVSQINFDTNEIYYADTTEIDEIILETEKEMKKVTYETTNYVPNYNIKTLTNYEQQRIYALCQMYNVDYKLVLAIFMTESSMDKNAINNNVAYGLGQWHKPSGTYALLESKTKEILNIDEVKWNNPIHNATGTIWYLNYLYTQLKNYEEKERQELTILAYNKGLNGAKSFAGESEYVKKVKKYYEGLEVNNDKM